MTFDNLWIRRALVFARFVELKSILAIIFEYIIAKAKQTELQMLYLVFFSKMMKKKATFELRIIESFIVSSSHWQLRQFQVSTPRFQASCPSTRSSSAKPMPCHHFGVFGVPSQPSSPMNDPLKPVLVVWGSSCKSCRRPTARSKN